MNTPAGGVTLPELLPCPFCGQQPRWHKDGLTLECCLVKGDYTREKLVAAWNTRAALAGEWRVPEGCEVEEQYRRKGDKRWSRVAGLSQGDQQKLENIMAGIPPYSADDAALYERRTVYIVPAAPLPKEPGR